MPFAIRKRGGGNLVITPDGIDSTPTPRSRFDSALLKALVRVFRWRKLLETGDYATIEEIAEAKTQPVLYQLGTTHDAASAGDRGGSSGSPSTVRSDDGDAAVSMGMALSKIHVISRQVPNSVQT